MKAWLKRLLRLFDGKSVFVEEVWRDAQAEALTISPVDLQRLLTAVNVATYNNFSHKTDSSAVILETRIATVDDFVVQLTIVNETLQNCEFMRNFERLMPSLDLVSLYDFLVSNEGYAIPLKTAIERSMSAVSSYLMALDWFLLTGDDRRYVYYTEKTELIRYHLREVMLSLIAVSDQVKSMQ